MKLVIAGEDHLDILLPLVSAYHDFAGLALSDEHRQQTVIPLLDPTHKLGAIWLVEEDGVFVGYLALCFGYSIEFGGRDAFVDEFFIVPFMRGKGIGSRVIQCIQTEARRLGVKALHLEVARSNTRAIETYSRRGFTSRDRYHLITCKLI